MDQELNIGDIVKFKRTIWQGQVGKIVKVTKSAEFTWIRVYIPRTLCHVLHEYAPSAVKKITIEGK